MKIKKEVEELTPSQKEIIRFEEGTPLSDINLSLINEDDLNGDVKTFDLWIEVSKIKNRSK
jgi:hypothetical protein